MPDEKDKRQIRNLKRVVKRAGSKHRRRELKRLLAEDPEGAAEHEESVGKHSSEGFNGLFRPVSDEES